MSMIIDFPKAGLKRPILQENSGLTIEAQKENKLKEEKKERSRQNLLKAASKLNW